MNPPSGHAPRHFPPEDEAWRCYDEEFTKTEKDVFWLLNDRHMDYAAVAAVRFVTGAPAVPLTAHNVDFVHQDLRAAHH